jgi:hypothetical protein
MLVTRNLQQVSNLSYTLELSISLLPSWVSSLFNILVTRDPPAGQ